MPLRLQVDHVRRLARLATRLELAGELANDLPLPSIGGARESVSEGSFDGIHHG